MNKLVIYGGLLLILFLILAGVTQLSPQLRTQIPTSLIQPESPDTAAVDEQLPSGPAEIVTNQILVRLTPEQHTCVRAATAPVVQPELLKPLAAQPPMRPLTNPIPNEVITPTNANAGTCQSNEQADSPTSPLNCNVPMVAALNSISECLTREEDACIQRGGTFTSTNRDNSGLASLISELRDPSLCTIKAESQWTCEGSSSATSAGEATGTVEGISTEAATTAMLGCLNLPAELTNQIAAANLVIPSQPTELTNSPPPGQETSDILRWGTLTFKGEQHRIEVQSSTNLEPAKPAVYGNLYTTYNDPASQQETVVPAHPALQALAATQRALLQLQESGFEKVEPVQIVRATVIPDDTAFSQLHGLNQIKAPAAWDTTTGAPEIVIAVTDTGLDFTHPDIQDNVWENAGESGTDSTGKDKKTNGIDDDNNGYTDDWRGWDFVDDDNDPTDDHGHGTHVAGTIAARGNNASGITGVMWRAKILPLKFLGPDGGTDHHAAAALTYAADRSRVSNNSWSGSAPSSIIQDALRYVIEKRGLPVVAAGNTGKDYSVSPQYPAMYEEAITVGATDRNSKRASFSSIGSALDVVAPGSQILSLRATGTTMGTPSTADSTLTSANGTSMAAPHVTGIIGLILSVHPEWSAEDIRSALYQTADDAGTPGKDNQFGFGIVNVARAVALQERYPQAQLTTPNGLYTAKGTVEIRGTATATSFQRYTVEMRTMPTGDWTANGIALTDNGTKPITNGRLGTLNLGPLSSGDYQVKVNVYDASGRVAVDQKEFTLNTSIVLGWPKTGFKIIWAMAIGNLDNSPDKEIVVADQFYLKAYKHDGTQLWSHQLSQNLFISAITIADLNKDGKNEIIVNVPPELYVLNTQGQSVSQAWPKQLGTQLNRSPIGSPAVADINNDGHLEMLLLESVLEDVPDRPPLKRNSPHIKIHALKFDGTALAGWPKTVSLPEGQVMLAYYNGEQSLVAQDIDHNGTIELFFPITSTTDDGHTVGPSYVFGLDHNGTTLAGWPTKINPQRDNADRSSTQNTIALGNITGDSTYEVVVVNFDGTAAAFTKQGGLVNNYPVNAIQHNFQPFDTFASPTLFDFNKDGLAEISMGKFLLNQQGLVSEWAGNLYQIHRDNLYTSSTLANLDPDAQLEVIIPNVQQSDKLYLGALGTDGSVVSGWPKPITKPVGGHPLVDDIDNDGKNEVIVELGWNTIMIWRSEGSPAHGTWPLTHRDAQNRRGAPRPVVSPTPSGVPRP